MEFSGATPPAGVEGELRPAGLGKIVPGFLEWPRYAVVNEAGETAAYLIVHVGLAGWEAPPIPLMNPQPFYPYPMVILAEADHHRFQEWLAQGRRVRVRLHNHAHPAVFRGTNVVATLPGESEESVVFCAHLDTAHGTPGANNNAGGVQALFDLAAELSARGRRRLTYRFLACDACEWGFLGSRFFLLQAEASGYRQGILAGINVDTVASGDSLYFLAWPQDMRRRAETVVERLELGEAFRQVEYLGRLAGSDHYSFLEAGIPAAEILFWPCPVYKLPEDDTRHVEQALVQRSVRMAAALAETFEEER
jgi:Iap family predicted aminopeptidase